MKGILILGVLFLAPLISNAFALTKQLPQDTQPSMQARIAEALKRAKRRVDSNGKQLARVTDGNVEGFSAEEVIQGVNQIRNQLLEELKGEELAGLRFYLEKHYPVASMSNL